MQRKQVFYLLAILALLVSMVSPLATTAQAQEGVVSSSDAPARQTCAPFSAAEQQEFDALTALKAAETLAGANLVHYDALAQQLACYSAQFAASAQPDQRMGATSTAPSAPGVCDTAGPIEVEGTVLGTTPTAYTTLGAAFAAINAGTHTGAITVDVCGNTTETATASLDPSGGTASYTSITVAPVGGPRVITGNIIGAIIKLAGADNVTIDGRIGGAGRNLTVSNTSTSAATAALAWEPACGWTLA